MKKGLIIILTVLTTNFAYSQNCSCADIFVWLKETIEKNDAGFQYVIDQKGEAEYKKHSDIYAEKVKTIKEKDDCAETLSNWLKFFRKGHLWFGVNFEKDLTNNSNQIDKEKINQNRRMETCLTKSYQRLLQYHLYSQILLMVCP